MASVCLRRSVVAGTSPMSGFEAFLLILGILSLLGCIWLGWLFVIAPSGSQGPGGFRLDGPPRPRDSLDEDR